MKDRKPIRLIASDLDGTLYYGARELGKMTPANRDAIVRWTEAGHRFLIATEDGRVTRRKSSANTRSTAISSPAMAPR